MIISHHLGTVLEHQKHQHVGRPINILALPIAAPARTILVGSAASRLLIFNGCHKLVPGGGRLNEAGFTKVIFIIVESQGIDGERDAIDFVILKGVLGHHGRITIL